MKYYISRFNNFFDGEGFPLKARTESQARIAAENFALGADWREYYILSQCPKLFKRGFTTPQLIAHVKG